jgi:hypothetical protein
MTKKNKGLPKSKIEKALKAKGFTMERVTSGRFRLWRVSDGVINKRYFSLQHIVNAFKIKL